MRPILHGRSAEYLLLDSVIVEQRVENVGSSEDVKSSVGLKLEWKFKKFVGAVIRVKHHIFSVV